MTSIILKTWLPQFRAKNSAGTVLLTYTPGWTVQQPWISVDIGNADDVTRDRQLTTYGERPGYVGVFWEATVVFAGRWTAPPAASGAGLGALATVLAYRFTAGDTIEAAFDYNGGTPVWKRVNVRVPKYSKYEGRWIASRLEIIVRTADPQTTDYLPGTAVW